MVTTDGDDVIDSISNMSVLRIDVPDYTHELTQFSWKLKQLDDRTKDRDNRADGLEQKLCLHADSEKAMYAVLKSAFGDLNRRMDKVEHALDRDQRIVDCRNDRELLHDILQIVNPIIKSGEYARPAQSGVVLAQRMWDVCHTIIDFRRKHNIVG